MVRLSGPTNGVLNHSQLIVRPSLARFSLVDRLPPRCSTIAAQTRSNRPCMAAGAMKVQ